MVSILHFKCISQKVKLHALNAGGQERKKKDEKQRHRPETKTGIKTGVDKHRQDICAMGSMPDCLTKRENNSFKYVPYPILAGCNQAIMCLLA